MDWLKHVSSDLFFLLIPYITVMRRFHLKMGLSLIMLRRTLSSNGRLFRYFRQTVYSWGLLFFFFSPMAKKDFVNKIDGYLDSAEAQGDLSLHWQENTWHGSYLKDFFTFLSHVAVVLLLWSLFILVNTHRRQSFFLMRFANKNRDNNDHKWRKKHFQCHMHDNFTVRHKSAAES